MTNVNVYNRNMNQSKNLAIPDITNFLQFTLSGNLTIMDLYRHSTATARVQIVLLLAGKGVQPPCWS